MLPVARMIGTPFAFALLRLPGFCLVRRMFDICRQRAHPDAANLVQQQLSRQIGLREDQGSKCPGQLRMRLRKDLPGLLRKLGGGSTVRQRVEPAARPVGGIVVVTIEQVDNPPIHLPDPVKRRFVCGLLGQQCRLAEGRTDCCLGWRGVDGKITTLLPLDGGLLPDRPDNRRQRDRR
jgi:hypothetical protein